MIQTLAKKPYLNRKFNCYQTGNGTLTEIFRGEDPKFFNYGIHGKNWDAYIDDKRNIAITTGDRNLTGKAIPYRLIEKYRNMVLDIPKGMRWTPEYLDKVKEIREEFLDIVKLL